MNCNDPDTTEQQYLEVIRCKTAKLFEAATRLGAVLGGGSGEQEQLIAEYGMHLGTAFQLVDDALDYNSSSDEIGKNVGDDLAEGKPTLPLIYAMRAGTEAQSATIREAIEKGGRERIEDILNAIESTGAIEYTAELAKAEAKLAAEKLSPLATSPYQEALASLAEFSVNRTY
jgi:octaprenyl-diphosphate synthase